MEEPARLDAMEDQIHPELAEVLQSRLTQEKIAAEVVSLLLGRGYTASGAREVLHRALDFAGELDLHGPRSLSMYEGDGDE